MKWICVAASISALTAPVAGCGIGDTLHQLARQSSTSTEALKFAEYTAGTGVDALVLGYPGAGSFKASPPRSARSPTSTDRKSIARRR